MGFFGKIFTWWNGATVTTMLNSALTGEKVGTDAQGNTYYRAKKPYPKGHPFAGKERRWVIYNGASEATRIPPGWHGWMHHRVDTPPSRESYAAREWQKPHQPNLTGTAGAYRPKGSILSNGHRPRVGGDYDAWTPGN